MKKLISVKKGFTIIEVVLVLAVAGLIFLMVFVAVPNMQRSRRDTSRRNDMSRLYTQVENYATNNKGKLPDPGSSNTDIIGTDGMVVTNGTFSARYVRTNGDTFTDPDGKDYKVTVTQYDQNAGYAKGTLTWPNDYTAYIVINGTCNGEVVAAGSGNRKFAVFYVLEGSGVFCQSN